MASKAKVSKNVNVNKNNTEQSCSTTGLTPELEQQFELELCWCIQQLQSGLKSGKLNNKQVQDHTKALNTLMSNTSPIIKKRQVMRLSFGDYRAKMAAEEKKRSRNTLNVKVKTGIPNKKSVFIKKSSNASSNETGFRFNFQPSANDIDNSMSSIQIENEDSCKSNSKDGKTNFCPFAPSDNSFVLNST